MRDCFRRLLVRDGDSKADADMKVFVFPVSLFLFCFAMFTSYMNMKNSFLTFALGAAMCALGTAVFMVGVLFNAASPAFLVDTLLVINTLGLCAMDLSAAALSDTFRPWGFIVLILDGCLVVRRVRIPLFVIPFTLLYVAAERIQSVYDISLYEVGYWGTGIEDSHCNCASPPCSNSAISGLLTFTGVCTVFLVDFYLTKGFSHGMHVQLARVKSSVEVAAQIAAALARYD
eukprot:Hpha_TRINITY_DN16363_c2_g1::TRINITY_DN16363_c2_g1_i1::g.60005::m.60005